MVKTINLERCFDSEGCSIKDGVQNGRQLGSYELFDQHTR